MPNPAVNPPGSTEKWIQRHFAVQTTTATILVEEDSSDDEWGAEEAENVPKRARKTADAPSAPKPLSKQNSESVEAIWGEDNGDDEDDGGWGEDACNDGDEWDAETPAADAWDSQAEDSQADDFTEVTHTYPCPPEEDTRACNSEYKDTKTVVDVLDYPTAAKRLVWLEREFQSKVAYIDEWPLERVRKLLRANNYDFRSVCYVVPVVTFFSWLP